MSTFQIVNPNTGEEKFLQTDLNKEEFTFLFNRYDAVATSADEAETATLHSFISHLKGIGHQAQVVGAKPDNGGDGLNFWTLNENL